MPAVQARLASIGAEVRAEGAGPFRDWLAQDTATWGGIIKANRISLD